MFCSVLFLFVLVLFFILLRRRCLFGRRYSIPTCFNFFNRLRHLLLQCLSADNFRRRHCDAVSLVVVLVFCFALFFFFSFPTRSLPKHRPGELLRNDGALLFSWWYSRFGFLLGNRLLSARWKRVFVCAFRPRSFVGREKRIVKISRCSTAKVHFVRRLIWNGPVSILWGFEHISTMGIFFKLSILSPLVS